MENNIIEKYKNETNETILKELGITFEEFRSLSLEELKLIFFSHKLRKLEKHAKENNNDVDRIMEPLKEETNQIILETYGITFEEFRTLSIPDLISLVREKKHSLKKTK